MSRSDNYPDDIRQFDNHPQSPFFVDPNAWMTEACDKLADEWFEELGTTGIIVDEDWSLADLVILMTEDGMDPESDNDKIEFLRGRAMEWIEMNPTEFHPSSHLNWD